MSISNSFAYCFVFLIFVKIHKNTSPMVLHISFAFFETWQITGEAWHLCKSVHDMANTNLPRLLRAIENPPPQIHHLFLSLYIVMAHAGLATALLVLYGLYLLLANFLHPLQ